MAVDASQLLTMSKPALDELFRASAAGAIPVGDTTGTVIANPGTFLAKLNAKAAHLIAWQGKVFSPATEDLKNKVTPFRVKSIRARVYKEASWFDGKECIVLDYSKSSKVAHWIRDEIREVSPGVYLGVVYWGKRRILKFALNV